MRKNGFWRSARLVSALVLGGVVATVAGCGGGGGSGGDSGGSTSNGLPPEVSPALLGFGKVVIGDTVNGAIVVKNRREGAITVTAEAPTDGAFVRTVDSDCTNLARYAECSIQVAFTPTEAKSYSATIRISDGTASVTTALSGTGQGLAVDITSAVQSCTDNNIISANFVVTGANNEPINNIPEAWVQSLFNGNAINFSSPMVVETQQQPVSVGIVLDWSESLLFFRPNLIDATTTFINSLGYTSGSLIDRAALSRFARRVANIEPTGFVNANTAGKDSLIASLNSDFTIAEDGTDVWGAVNSMITKTAAESSNPIRAVVLLSDGRQTVAGDATLQEAIDNATAENIPVFTIGFGRLNSGTLGLLAEDTGGKFYADPEATGLDAIFDDISGALINKYTVTYQGDGSAGTLKITVTKDTGASGDDTSDVAACPG